MHGLVRLSLAVLFAVGTIVLPTGAAAAPRASTTFALVGYEYAFTSTVGRFAGPASADSIDAGAWNARVEHDKLGSRPTYVDGGTFQVASHDSGWDVDTITGTFVHHGGAITTLDPGARCTNQRYLVTGRLRDVTNGGSGMFAAVLTHYRHSILGHCLIYKARVAGNVRFER